MSKTRRAVFLVVAIDLFLTAGVTPAHAQALITVNENVNFKIGALGQFQADWLEDPAEDETQQNLFIRRVRIMFGGQVAKNVTFFMETDAANLGKTLSGGKNISPQMIIQDAYGEVKMHGALLLDFGLMFVPFSHNYLQSAGTLLPIDYGAYTYTTSASTQSATGRDTGVQARGFFLDNHLEYRIGAFQGVREAGSHNAFRYAGRVQFQFLEPEATGFFYTGTYLGKKKVASVAAAFDKQDEYSAYDTDAFFDYPIGPGALTAQAGYNRIDGDTTFTTLPKQNVVLLELGYLISDIRITPVLQYTKRDVLDTREGDEKRWSLGVNYWWAAHNANVKAAYGRIDPRDAKRQNQFTIQFQLFYY